MFFDDMEVFHEEGNFVYYQCGYCGNFVRKRKWHFKTHPKCRFCTAPPLTEYTIQTYIKDRKVSVIELPQSRSKGLATLRCSKHGEFKISIQTILKGKAGCPKCKREKVINEKTIEIKQKLIDKFGNFYGLDFVRYLPNEQLVLLDCPIHGPFVSNFKMLLRREIKYGCPKCGKYFASRKRSLGLEEFLRRVKQIFGNKYDFSLITKYKNNHTKVPVICKKHGVFWTYPMTLLKGHGCPKCVGKNRTQEEIINLARQLHADSFEYRGVSKTTQGKAIIKVLCKNCGREYETLLNNHLKGVGCRYCSKYIKSSLEDFIEEILVKERIKYLRRYRKGRLELDFFLPEHDLAIETHGLYWHSFSYRDLIKRRLNKNRHKEKAKIAFNNGIKLLQFLENEINKKPNVVESIIKSNLGLNYRIYARECNIVEVPKDVFIDFLENNHLYTPVVTSLMLGLEYNNQLVMVMGITKTKDTFEIKRLSSKTGVTVVGGASKLFKYFLKKYYQPGYRVISFADARFSCPNQNVFISLGFRFVRWTKPNYFYINPKEDKQKLLHRIHFQKHKLPEILENFDPTQTELENVLKNGYWVFYDAGHFLFDYRSEEKTPY